MPFAVTGNLALNDATVDDIMGVMPEPHFAITTYGDGYIAFSNTYGRITSAALKGFGDDIRNHAKQQGADVSELTLSLAIPCGDCSRRAPPAAARLQSRVTGLQRKCSRMSLVLSITPRKT